MKKTIGSLIAGLLLAATGVASAAEPVTLTDSQMDTVAAGSVSSTSFGTALALLGASTSSSTTAAVLTSSFAATGSASASLSLGVLPVAITAAASSIN